MGDLTFVLAGPGGVGSMDDCMTYCHKGDGNTASEDNDFNEDETIEVGEKERT